MKSVYPGNMSRFGNRPYEGSVVAGTNEDVTIRSNREIPSIDETRYHRTNTGDVKNIIHEEFEGPLCLLFVPATLRQGKKQLTKQVHSFSCYA